MKVNLKSILRNTKVLYGVFFLALINFFGFVMARNFNAVIIFLFFGIITRHFFSKNMIVILLSAMVITNAIQGITVVKNVVEGMVNADDKDTNSKNKNTNSKNTNSKNKDKKKKAPITTEKFDTLNPANVNSSNLDSMDEDNEDESKPKLDYASTLESAYDNLDKLLGSDAIRSMSEDTQRLAEKQKNLMGNIQKLEPMMNKAGDMLQGLDINKMGSMLKGLEGKMSMFGGGEKGVKKSNEDDDDDE